MTRTRVFLLRDVRRIERRVFAEKVTLGMVWLALIVMALGVAGKLDFDAEQAEAKFLIVEE